ncbi:MAG: zinc-binding alcohol dehydrogenase family protein [Acidobacteriaceae bacterium]
MKALVIKAPGEIALETVPDLPFSQEDVRLRVRMVGLCGSDLNTFRGKNPLVTFPCIPGHEIAATIEHVPPHVMHLQPGMNVTLSPYTSCGNCPSCKNNRPNACQFNQTLGVQRDGALTEYINVPAAKIYPAPGLSIKELALVEPLTVGFHAAARGQVKAQDIVAVYGCGGVGLGAIAASAFRGARTIAMDVDDTKLALARKAGATDTINSRQQSVHDVLQQITHGRGPDVVIEAIGLPDTFRGAVEEVSFTGRVVYIGYAKEPVAYETRLFVQKELDVRGSRNALPEDFAEVIRMLQEHRFPVDEAVSRIVPMEEAAEALNAWSDNPSSFSKILIQMD